VCSDEPQAKKPKKAGGVARKANELEELFSHYHEGMSVSNWLLFAQERLLTQFYIEYRD
jgi:hypothetical protein